MSWGLGLRVRFLLKMFLVAGAGKQIAVLQGAKKV